ncbi:hypothetical protein AB1N83_004950 [Pleurotus pulmonarius]
MTDAAQSAVSQHQGINWDSVRDEDSVFHKRLAPCGTPWGDTQVPCLSRKQAGFLAVPRPSLDHRICRMGDIQPGD